MAKTAVLKTFLFEQRLLIFWWRKWLRKISVLHSQPLSIFLSPPPFLFWLFYPSLSIKELEASNCFLAFPYVFFHPRTLHLCFMFWKRLWQWQANKAPVWDHDVKVLEVYVHRDSTELAELGCCTGLHWLGRVTKRRGSTLDARRSLKGVQVLF